MAIKKLTFLHSNDLHGDFFIEEKGDVKEGGIARLSGYVKKVRAEEDGVIYAVAGDMFKGSIIDSEFQGLSTIELMNLVSPDVITIGNHEVDYGVRHLLFVEKCARFPIINANLYIKTNHVRMFEPYKIIKKNGVKVMFIGIITDEVLNSTKGEALVGAFVDVEAAAKEIGIICDTYRTTDIDYIVLLTHIGIEKDRELAALLKPEWGVNLIVGGHSHTKMDEPVIVNDIPIVQAYTGSDQIGRMDLTFDTEKHELIDSKWQLVPITDQTCEEDPLLVDALEHYKTQTDLKYSKVVTSFVRKLTHPARNQETELGNLFADIMQDGSSFDIMVLGSGSLRLPELGPVVQLQNLKEFFPYDDSLYMLKVTGSQLKRMVRFMLREDAFTGGHTEFYQFSKGCRFVWSRSRQEFDEFSFRGREIKDDDLLKIGMQYYHFTNFDDFFGIPLSEIAENQAPRLVASSCGGVYEELLSTSNNLDAHVEGRIVVNA